MFYMFTSMVEQSWHAWSGLFDFMPYGDPYVAGVVLFVAVATTCKLVADDRI